MFQVYLMDISQKIGGHLQICGSSPVDTLQLNLCGAVALLDNPQVKECSSVFMLIFSVDFCCFQKNLTKETTRELISDMIFIKWL